MSSWQQEAEAQFLEDLRGRYESQGFTFVVEPRKGELPDFLGTYIPDALARKPGQNVAIEVKRRKTPSTERTLRDIRRLFEGHSDWQFHVVFMGGEDPLQSVAIPASVPAAICARINEVRALADQGHRRAAFIMAWTLLEAALRAMDAELGNSPRTPGTVVQRLAMNGYIGPELERRIRGLIQLRNGIVHGDLTLDVTSGEISQVLSAVEETLKTNLS